MAEPVVLYDEADGVAFVTINRPAKKNTLTKLYLCLRDLEPRIEMDEELRRKALKPLERMLSIATGA